MALIDCPSCRQKISSKAPVCSHCQFDLKQSSPDDVIRKEKLNKFRKQNGIQTQSMFAMMLFIGGFAVMYMGGTQPQDTRYKIAVAALVIGFIWYIVGRIRLFLFKLKDNK